MHFKFYRAKYYLTSIAVAVLLPAIVWAVPIPGLGDPLDTPPLPGAGGSGQTFGSVVSTLLTSVATPLVYLLFAVALLFFLIGVVKYINKSGEESERQAGHKMMVYGIIGLFVMIAVWGLVNVVKNTFDLEITQPPYPTFRTSP